MKILRLIQVTVMSLMISVSANASDWLTITDMSQLEYQIKDGKVYFRNIDDFNSSWLGCCYAYYLNIESDQGKAVWSSMLMNIAMGGEYNIGVTDKTVNGSPITSSGKW